MTATVISLIKRINKKLNKDIQEVDILFGTVLDQVVIDKTVLLVYLKDDQKYDIPMLFEHINSLNLYFKFSTINIHCHPEILDYFYLIKKLHISFDSWFVQLRRLLFMQFTHLQITIKSIYKHDSLNEELIKYLFANTTTIQYIKLEVNKDYINDKPYYHKKSISLYKYLRTIIDQINCQKDIEFPDIMLINKHYTLTLTEQKKK